MRRYCSLVLVMLVGWVSLPEFKVCAQDENRDSAFLLAGFAFGAHAESCQRAHCRSSLTFLRCHSGARRRREPGIQSSTHPFLLWIPGPPLRGVPE